MILKNIVFITVLFAFSFSCNSNSSKTNSVEEIIKKETAKIKETVKEEKVNPKIEKSTMEMSIQSHELISYFNQTESLLYTNCHSEKGPSDDFLEGKIIPKIIAKNHKLYKTTLAPSMAMKFRQNNDAVSFRAIQAMKYEGKYILIYGIGINMEGDEIPDKEMVEIRAVVLNKEKAVEGNYFVGGYAKEQEKEEKTVCRSMQLDNNEITFEINDESFNIPSAIRLNKIEKRSF